MKFLSFLFIIGVLSNCASQKTTASVAVPTGKDTSIVGRTDTTSKEEYVPDCILKMIDSFSAEKIQNPPRKIIRYKYKGQFVYYVQALCCDQYSALYDSACKLLGHPDGGFTGRGDGKLPDFTKMRNGEKLVWEDKRK